MHFGRPPAIAFHLFGCLFLGCIAADGPPSGETVVLLRDNAGRVVSRGSATYLVMEADTASAASWLVYSEAPRELPWPARTVRAPAGRAVPLPDRMSPVGTGTEVSPLQLADRRLDLPPSPCDWSESELIPSSLARATRWTSDTVLQPTLTPSSSTGARKPALEVRGLSGMVASTTLAIQLNAVESVGPERALGNGTNGQLVVIDSSVFRGRAPRAVQFDLPPTPDPEVTQLAANKGRLRDFAYYLTGKEVYRISSVGQATRVSADSTATEVFGAGDHVMTISGLEAYYIDTPNSVFTVDPMDASYLGRLGTAAYLPTHRGESLFAIAYGPVGVVLLRYGGTSWRPQVVLHDVRPRGVLLGGNEDGIVFGHSGGWAVYDTLRGLRCLGLSRLREVSNIIALSNGTYYVQGSDAVTGAASSAWLVPN